MDDASLHRLAEIGIDVYLPRADHGAQAAAIEPAAVIAATAEVADVAAPALASPHGLLLVAPAPTDAARALRADIERALGFARVACRVLDAADEGVLAAAAALVVFGEAQARAVGALLPAQRQRELGWVVAGELAALAGDAVAKRALWSELRRAARALAARPAAARG